MKKALLLAILLFPLAVGSAGADTINYVNTPVYTTSAITTVSATGATMAGMSVTAYFSDQTSETLNWASTVASSGGVTGANWYLNVNGDTFTADWVLHVTSPAGASVVGITGLFINGIPGNTTFDALLTSEGTPGSAPGLPFVRRSGGTDTTATYAGPLALDGFAPVGDLYASLDLVFAAAFVGEMTFGADTDNVTTQIVPGPTPAPEPVSLLLVGFGLLGLAGIRRKTQK